MKKGFTVLELLVVIAIIGILSSIILVSYNGYTDKARLAKTLQWAGGVNHSLGDRAVGAWTFDNITGATVYDDSGNNNNGTAFGGPAVVNGVVGKALSFDGVDDYVGAPYNVGGDTTGGYNFYAYNKFLCFEINNIDGFCSTLAVLDVNKWHYAVSTHISNNYNFYIDSIFSNAVINTNNPGINTANLLIGRRGYDTCCHMNGLIDDVRIFSAALTQAQIQQHYTDSLEAHHNLLSCEIK